VVSRPVERAWHRRLRKSRQEARVLTSIARADWLLMTHHGYRGATVDAAAAYWWCDLTCGGWTYMADSATKCMRCGKGPSAAAKKRIAKCMSAGRTENDTASTVQAAASAGDATPIVVPRNLIPELVIVDDDNMQEVDKESEEQSLVAIIGKLGAIDDESVKEVLAAKKRRLQEIREAKRAAKPTAIRLLDAGKVVSKRRTKLEQAESRVK
jgi:hypothetical protein